MRLSSGGGAYSGRLNSSAAGEALDLRGPGDALEDLSGPRAGQLARLGGAGEGTLDLRSRAIQRCLLGLVEDDAQSSLGDGLGNSGAHEAGADDAHSLDLTRVLHESLASARWWGLDASKCAMLRLSCFRASQNLLPSPRPRDGSEARVTHASSRTETRTMQSSNAETRRTRSVQQRAGAVPSPPRPRLARFLAPGA